MIYTARGSVRRAAKMRRLFEAAQANRRTLGEERDLVLRYEDVVADTAAAARRIAGFLEIEGDPCLSRRSGV